jgi:hypothetical protein
MKIKIIFFIAYVSFGIAANGQVDKSDQVVYGRAVELVSRLLSSGRNEIAISEIIIAPKKINFSFEDFAAELIGNSQDRFLKIYDSLRSVSKTVNQKCLLSESNNHVRLEDSLTGKHILFFSEICCDRLQASIFIYNPRLTLERYLDDYYGGYTTILMEFDRSKNVVKSYYATFDSN